MSSTILPSAGSEGIGEEFFIPMLTITDLESVGLPRSIFQTFSVLSVRRKRKTNSCFAMFVERGMQSISCIPSMNSTMGLPFKESR
jgi:hypothetical protein